MAYKIKLCLLVIIARMVCLAKSMDLCRGGDFQTCICEFSDNSGTINLTGIGPPVHKPWYQDIQSTWSVQKLTAPFFFSYNPCFDFNGCRGDTPGVAITRWPGDPVGFCYGVAVMNTSRFLREENGNATLHYMSYDGTSSATVYLECNEDMNKTDFISFGEDQYTHNFTFRLVGPDVCPMPAHHQPLSPVFIATILICVLLFTFLATGIVYRVWKNNTRRKNQAFPLNNTEEFETNPFVKYRKNVDACKSDKFSKYGSTDSEGK